MVNPVIKGICGIFLTIPGQLYFEFFLLFVYVSGRDDGLEVAFYKNKNVQNQE